MRDSSADSEGKMKVRVRKMMKLDRVGMVGMDVRRWMGLLEVVGKKIAPSELEEVTLVDLLKIEQFEASQTFLK